MITNRIQIPRDDPRRYRDGDTIVLGLDPSMTATGYAVVCWPGQRLLDAGTIKTDPAAEEPLRVWTIASEVVRIIREHCVHHVAMEQFQQFYRSEASPEAEAARAAAGGKRVKYKGTNPKSMFLMKSAQTAAQTAALMTGCPLFLYPVHEWKGGRRVGKEAIVQKAQLLYRVPSRNDNICDATMIAHHHRLQAALRPDRGVLPPASERAEILRLALGTDGAGEGADPLLSQGAA